MQWIDSDAGIYRIIKTRCRCSVWRRSLSCISRVWLRWSPSADYLATQRKTDWAPWSPFAPDSFVASSTASSPASRSLFSDQPALSSFSKPFSLTFASIDDSSHPSSPKHSLHSRLTSLIIDNHIILIIYSDPSRLLEFESIVLLRESSPRLDTFGDNRASARISL